MWFASYLYKSSVITGDQFAQVVTTQLDRQPLIGQVAVKEKALKPQQLLRVLEVQSEDHDRSFGNIALDLGYLTEQQLSHLVVKQAQSVDTTAQILVELGIFSQERMELELEKARHDMKSRAGQQGVSDATVPLICNMTAL